MVKNDTTPDGLRKEMGNGHLFTNDSASQEL